MVSGYFDNWYSALFLEALPKELTGPVVVRDGGSLHKGDPIRELQGAFAGRLILERLPPYAPDLNPVEFVWGRLKYGRLDNFAPRDAAQSDERIVIELTAVQDDQELLQSFVDASELPLRLTLLS